MTGCGTIVRMNRPGFQETVLFEPPQSGDLPRRRGACRTLRDRLHRHREASHRRQWRASTPGSIGRARHGWRGSSAGSSPVSCGSWARWPSGPLPGTRDGVSLERGCEPVESVASGPSSDDPRLPPATGSFLIGQDSHSTTQCIRGMLPVTRPAISHRVFPLVSTSPTAPHCTYVAHP